MRHRALAAIAVAMAFCRTTVVSADTPMRRGRVLPRTVIVTQMPFGTIYNLRDRADGYLGRYVDNPLIVDAGMPMTRPDGCNAWYSMEEFRQTCGEILSYGIDGFVSASCRPAWWFALAGERRDSGNCLNVTALLPDRANAADAVKVAMSDPNGLRHGGKAILLSYQCDRQFSPEALAKRLAELRAECGDGFLFVIDVSAVAEHQYRRAFRREGRLPPAIASLFDNLFRRYLRAADGIYLGETHMMYDVAGGMRRFDGEYYRTVVGRLCAVLEEPEFAGAGKLLALSAITGHMNPSRIGFNTPEDGTLALRESFEVALDANPDIIVLPEWDEYNENTCFAPTLYNGTAVKRVVRHFAAKARGEPPTPIPGDDLSRPNLVVSYRKSLAPGELADVEVLNVPDGGRSGPLECTVEFIGEKGRTLQTFPWREFEEDRLGEARFTAAGERFAAAARALRVRLRYRTPDGRCEVLDDGLCAIDLAPAADWNVKCVKQPIRDLAPMRRADVRLVDGKVSVDIESAEPLRHVMLCENGRTSYLHSDDAEAVKFREDGDYAVFAVSRSGWRGWKDRMARYRVAGVPEAEWFCGREAPGGWFAGEVCDKVNYLDWYPLSYYLRVPKSRLADAEVEFDFPGRYHGRIPLAGAYRLGAVADGGPGGTQFVVSRLDRAFFYPPALGRAECSFAVAPVMDTPSTLCQIQAVTMSGLLWRSRPLVLEHASPAVPVRVWSAADDAPADIELPAARVPRLDYDFSPDAGDVVRVRDGGWRRFWGMGGGTFVALPAAGNRGTLTAAGIRPGQPFYSAAEDARPRRELQDDGSWALVFDGRDDFVSLPWGAIPRTAGFAVSMEVWPEAADGVRLLFAARDTGYGSLQGLWLDEGCVSFAYDGLKWDETSARTSLALVPGRWNRLALRYHVDTIEIDVDGRVERFPCVFPGRYSSACMLGGCPPDRFFSGKIRNFSIDHAASR